MIKLLAKIIIFFGNFYDRLLMYIYKSQFAECRKNVKFYPTRSRFFYGNIFIGNDVFIGDGAYFIASDSCIKIGNKVLFGSNVSIVGGNHSTHIIGSLWLIINFLTNWDQTINL
jgi:acetyltransferase-like isoleucine patch superfamily enzyme